mmetsp:Transcript_3603/g.9347  ORF Transcript_3603/g.9347 Transcript_3603/m.9347 type:complete len:300 (-) Transcript_3603:611-1510(-)
MQSMRRSESYAPPAAACARRRQAEWLDHARPVLDVFECDLEVCTRVDVVSGRRGRLLIDVRAREAEAACLREGEERQRPRSNRGGRALLCRLRHLGDKPSAALVGHQHLRRRQLGRVIARPVDVEAVDALLSLGCLIAVAAVAVLRLLAPRKVGGELLPPLRLRELSRAVRRVTHLCRHGPVDVAAEVAREEQTRAEGWRWAWRRARRRAGRRVGRRRQIDERACVIDVVPRDARREAVVHLLLRACIARLRPLRPREVRLELGVADVPRAVVRSGHSRLIGEDPVSSAVLVPQDGAVG